MGSATRRLLRLTRLLGALLSKLLGKALYIPDMKTQRASYVHPWQAPCVHQLAHRRPPQGQHLSYCMLAQK